MIALFAEKQHAAEFDYRFRKLFTDLTRFARSHGIDGYYALGGCSNSEDPEEFAQECLIEYSNRARRDGFRKVRTGLIKRIAHNRVVDAWRKRDRSRKRDEFQAFTKELAEHARSIDEDCDLFAIPELQCLSDKAVEILRLKHVAEWRDREVANAVGMTIDGVRS